MARQSERQASTVMVPKGEEQPDSPKIHTLGSNELRKPAKRISKVNEQVRELAREMLRSMYAAHGIGLAAPQVGVHQQLLVIDLDPEEAANPPLVLINPEIVATSGALATYEAGRLSLRPSRLCLHQSRQTPKRQCLGLSNLIPLLKTRRQQLTSRRVGSRARSSWRCNARRPHLGLS